MFTKRRHNLSRRGMTLLEMVLAISITAVVFAALLPQFRVILNSWATREGAAESMQNARVLIDHLNRNLSKAVRITDVSDSSETDGYIQFENNDGDDLRYEIAGGSVQFGVVGDLYDLAGPVSQFQFSCYDAYDLDTPITDIYNIRFVKVQATLANPTAMGRDITFTVQTYLRTNTSNLVGWWKLDESSGLTAADSSIYGNDGSLENMAGDEWTTGIVDGALEFDGDNDYIDCGNDDSLNIRNEITMCAWVNLSSRPAKDDWFDIITKGDMTYNMYVQGADTGLTTLAAHFDLDTGEKDLWMLTSIDIPPGEWVHVAVIFDNIDFKLYVNGVLDHTENAPGTIDDNAGEDLVLVKGNGDYLDGSLDDVRIYNRALEPAELAQSANILTYKEFTEAKVSSDDMSITIDTPAGTSEGDLLIASVATDGDTAGSLAPPVGEGWTEIDVEYENGEVTLGAWWKNADASESASHQFTWSGDETAYGWIMRFTGHDPTDPIDDWANDGESSASPSSPSATTTVDGCLILRLGGFDDGDITGDDPGLSGHTAITMDSSGGGSSPVGWWKLDDGSGLTAADSSGNGNDGTLINMAGNEWTSGHVGGALEFDGNNDYIDCGNDDSLNITDEITMSAWINMSARPAKDDWADIAFKVGAYSLYLFGQKDTETVVAAYFVLDTGTIDTGKDGDIKLPLNSWVHVAVTFDGTDAKGYVNGELDFTKKEAGTIDTTTNPFTIVDTDGEYYEGFVDDVRVYNRALDGDEITALYNGEEPGGSGVTVSGGAGYVKQSAAGGSGISDFSLTASQESRTITIAIAPDPAGGGVEVWP